MAKTSLFLFGPFADPEILSALADGMDVHSQSVALSGHRLVAGQVAGAATLGPAAGAQIHGVLIVDPDVRLVSRLRDYLAIHGCPLQAQSLTLSGQTQNVLAPAGTPATPVADWDGAVWHQRWAQIWREAVPEILRDADIIPIAEIQNRLPVIWSRADARLSVRSEPRMAQGGLNAQDVRLERVQRRHSGFFALDEVTVSHRQFNGAWGPSLQREVFVAADAVTVLPYDPVRDTVLLVEQIRMGPLMRQDPCPWVLEPIAGRIEPGDTPEETAHKEAMEEAGLTLGALHHVGSYYPSTGCFTEYVHSYIGIADLPEAAARLGGVEAEGEDIQGYVFSRGEMMRRISEGTLPDGPLLLSAFWLQANLSSLRGVG